MDMNKTTDDQNCYFKVAEGVWGLKDIFVNVYFIANPDHSWVLLDAGLKTGYPKIKKAAAEIFGEDMPPKAIILTHGHFDHVGSLERLLEDWQVPVIVHFLELPYVTGKSAYPPPDPTVGGGAMASMSWLYPNDPIDVSYAVKTLPVTHAIPDLPEWKYYHTPGHAPGHISLWREKDKLLLAGDAFVTTKQESAWCVALQRKVIAGPPKYFTYDWHQSLESVATLANLEPMTVATGHGKPISGSDVSHKLTDLVRNFSKDSLPAQGRYLKEPAVANRDGVVYVPEENWRGIARLLVLTAVVLSLPLTISALKKRM
jgi:glyoxylase-like metal-dependent hydrolase (beta-lactamase superfamily II)